MSSLKDYSLDDAFETVDTTDIEGIIMEVYEDCEHDDGTGSSTNSQGFNKKAYKWNNQTTLELIEIYQGYPELYNYNCNAFRNRYHKNEVLKSIAQHFGTDVKTIKKRIHALRTRYTSEIKTMKRKNITCPRWPLFDAVKFLYDESWYTPPPRYNKEGHQDDPTNFNTQEALIELVESEFENSKTQLQKDVVVPAKNCSCACKKRDEFTAIGETVAAELRLTKDHEMIHQLLKDQILRAMQEARILMAEVTD